MFPSTPPRRTDVSAVGFTTPERRPAPSTTPAEITRARAIFQTVIESLESTLKATRVMGPFEGRAGVIDRLISEIAERKASLARFEEKHGLYPRPR